ncbi:MAG TPA: DUF1003 domain-containing protein [Ktedonobacteraceae bacterium]|nr:DUF1003 domain-containing protein [Ktedonobacteraceae bacterium]
MGQQSLPSTKSSSSYAENFKHMLGGLQAQFPKFKHEKHGPVVNVNDVADEKLTMGQKVADAVASTVGSWPFIITQSIILASWIIYNSLVLGGIVHFDPYPFILLNLALSFQAAYAAPFVMMSQNRQAEKDRLTAQNDYLTDCKGEEEVRHIMEHLDHQDTLTLQIVQRLELQNQRVEQQEQLIVQLVQKMDSQHQMLEAQRAQLLQWLSVSYPEVAKQIESKAD